MTIRRISRIAVAVVATSLLVAGLLRGTLGGGSTLENRGTAPLLSFEAVEQVVDLDYPPGNIAVSAEGRVFLTLHPDGRPPQQVLELVDGALVPFPNEAFQHRDRGFDSVLSIRIDRQGRLWALDFARFGRGQPRLWGFDLASRNLVHDIRFSPQVAGLGSMLNDFQVDAEGRYIYIAETSPIVQRPALIVHDLATGLSRRLLHRHPSTQSEALYIDTPGRRMMLPGGLLPLRIGIDSIALSRNGEWLYYGAVTASRLYRLRTSDLVDTTLDEKSLAARVEDFADKSLSDGLTTDDEGNVYLTDMGNSAIHRVGPDGRLQTVVADPRLRWPDGLSFGPDGWLYVTCSALQQVLFRSDAARQRHSPYQIWRLRPGVGAAAGH